MFVEREKTITSDENCFLVVPDCFFKRIRDMGRIPEKPHVIRVTHFFM